MHAGCSVEDIYVYTHTCTPTHTRTPHTRTHTHTPHTMHAHPHTAGVDFQILSSESQLAGLLPTTPTVTTVEHRRRCWSLSLKLRELQSPTAWAWITPSRQPAPPLTVCVISGTQVSTEPHLPGLTLAMGSRPSPRDSLTVTQINR